MSANDLDKMLHDMRAAARRLRKLSTEEKNAALSTLAQALVRATPELIKANAEDLNSLSTDTTPAFRDRLLINEKRVEGMAESLRQVAALPDPVGEVVEQRVLANGLKLRRVRAPLGVIFMIFESRPNVILEAFSLAFKTGNAIILRGGSESRATSSAIYKIMRGVFKETAFYGFEDFDRKHVETLLKRDDMIDIVVPRGGDKLIQYVKNTATMPIIKNDRGLCHTYVAEDADLDMAVKIVANAKVQRPGVCNSLETVLVNAKVAEKFLPMLYKETANVGLEWHVDDTTLKILRDADKVRAAVEQDWSTEYLDLKMNCRVVQNLDEALAHIERHGSKHSEAIITKSPEKANRFQDEVDAAAVYWNASTRFTDGFEFGLGGELGISTQKLHVRGPVGLRELTTPRWIIEGQGQIR